MRKRFSDCSGTSVLKANRLPASRSPAEPSAAAVVIKEGGSICSAKRARGNVSNRRFDNFIDVSIRCHTYDAVTMKAAVPEVAFGVYGRPIWTTMAKVSEKRNFVGDIARLQIIVKPPNRVSERVAEIEISVVGAPGDRVGDTDISSMFAYLNIGVYPVQHTI
jgi:hypothetical protein